MRRFTRLSLRFALLHFFVSLGALLLSVEGLRHVDDPWYEESTAAQVASATFPVLQAPGLAAREWIDPAGQSDAAEWGLVLGNSLAWGLGLALIWTRVRRNPRKRGRRGKGAAADEQELAGAPPAAHRFKAAAREKLAEARDGARSLCGRMDPRRIEVQLPKVDRRELQQRAGRCLRRMGDRLAAEEPPAPEPVAEPLAPEPEPEQRRGRFHPKRWFARGRECCRRSAPAA